MAPGAGSESPGRDAISPIARAESPRYRDAAADARGEQGTGVSS
jgi:hypothetical protein